MATNFIIQVCWSDDRIYNEWSSGVETEEEVIQEAKKELQDPTFEADYVRVITDDGELVWDSRKAES